MAEGDEDVSAVMACWHRKWKWREWQNSHYFLCSREITNFAMSPLTPMLSLAFFCPYSFVCLSLFHHHPSFFSLLHAPDFFRLSFPLMLQNAMTNNHISLFCLVDEKTTSNAPLSRFHLQHCRWPQEPHQDRVVSSFWWHCSKRPHTMARLNPIRRSLHPAQQCYQRQEETWPSGRHLGGVSQGASRGDHSHHCPETTTR